MASNVGRKAVDKLPPDVWEGISPHIDGFKEYWKGLFGEVEENILEGLDSHQKKLVGALTPSQMKIWSELDVFEKEIFYEIDDNNSRDDFLQRKKIRNSKSGG